MADSSMEKSCRKNPHHPIRRFPRHLDATQAAFGLALYRQGLAPQGKDVAHPHNASNAARETMDMGAVSN